MTSVRNGQSNPNKERIVAALDIGTTKIACLIATIDSQGQMTIKGMGHRPARGIKQGVVVDLEQASESICAAVAQAENIADITLREVIVSLSAGNPTSHVLDYSVSLNGSGVLQSHIEEALNAASQRAVLADSTLVHVFPACFALDESLGVAEPVGMYGKNLLVTTHAVVAKNGPLRNLETCVQRSHLSLSRSVLSPYASALATLVDDEKELGAACIDMGGGTTSLAVFVRGRMVHGEVIPSGGDDITQSIASSLLTPIVQAERLKMLHGLASSANANDRETIEVPRLGAGETDEHTRISRKVLARSIEPHLTGLFDTLRGRLEACGFSGPLARRVVITGGASQIAGVAALAERVLDREIRLGRPAPIPGLPETAHAPQFATVVGLLKYDLNAPMELGRHRSRTYIPNANHGAWSRLQGWLRENF